jgi:protein SCO1/2
MNLKRLRLLLWLVAGIAALAGLSIALRPPSPPGDTSTELPLASIGGPFTLVGSDGKPFSSSQLAGRPFAIFFGFTHCPDVCPVTLARLAKLRRALGKGDKAFEIVFVSVDPERDGPAEVGTYAKAFATPIIGLTGSPAQIEQVKKSYGIFSAKVAQAGGGYSVDHTATTLLMDKAGKFVATIAPDEPDATALDKLRRIAG